MWQEESDESSANSDNSDDEAMVQAAAEAEEKDAQESPAEKTEEAGESNDDVESEYEQSEDKGEDEEEDQESDEDDKSSASTSSDGSSASSSPQPKKNGRKIDEKTRKLMEKNNYLRRSSRAKPSETYTPQPPSRFDSDELPSDESMSEDDQPKRKPKKTKAKNSTTTSSKGVTRKVTKKSVDYTEKDTDEDVDEDDVLEWEEDVPTVAVTAAGIAVETIERVIKTRRGIVGATGSATTCYNVVEKGDPNTATTDDPQYEDQYFIKWVGWSYLHNTWETEATIVLMGAAGLKKVQNFIKKQAEIDSWRSTADKEYIEYYDCDQVMREELCDQYTIPERIVAHQVSRDKTLDGTEATEYYVKWSCLSYAECTWEDERLLPRELLDEYHRRVKNFKAPNKSAPALRKRPKFSKLDETPDYLIQGGLKGQILRDYQLEGLNWMLHAWSKNNSCILADEMGLGKTIQSISFLSSLYHRYDVYGPFLVVVPLSTMAAWQKEFKQWGSNLNLVTYMGDGSSREQIRQFEWYVVGTKKLKINAALTTYEILLKDKAFLGSFEWAALAVDEAHRLKNDESLLYKCLSQFHSDHRLLITGTPLQNSLKELWALLHFIMPDKFESWEDFENDHNDKDHKGISALHRKLEPYLLRRVKKDVEKSLPPKLEQILRVDMTAQQKQYYKWILTKNYRELSKGVKGSINGFVNLVMELKKCCNHTSLVRQYDYYENEAQARLQQLLKSSGKLILLDKLLCRLRDTGHRVLIFSQMVMMLDILQEYLQLRRFPSQRLDGSMRADLRKQALDHFNADGSTDFCFLLSTRAGGLGINLATADTVIIFDSDWNPQNDLQAMSRAHRIGQTKTVNIYRLVTRASVEEEIVERAKRKLVLDHLVIQRMDTSGRTVLSKSAANGSVPFDKHELNDILKFGAAELFKEKEGEEQEPEVDIDRILMGAETRDAEEDQENNSDLLNSFKYANFAIDEEKDVAAAAQKTGGGEDWDEIIPEEERLKVEEEERKKFDVELAPRQRTKIHEGAEEESGSSSDSEAEGGKKRRRKPWGDFTGTEIKRFVRAFRKFAKPHERLEALAQEAELEEHSPSELQGLCEALSEGCKKAEEEYSAKNNLTEKKEGDKKDRGPFFKFAGVIDVNVKQIRKMHKDLEALHEAFAGPSSETWKMPSKLRNQKGWDVEWTEVDDNALLKGIFKYGYGSWESVKMDPELGLADKIFLKDKVKKPQRSHIQQRAEYLLKLLSTSPGKSSTTGKHNNNHVRERKRKANDDGKAKTPTEKKRKDKDHHSTKETNSKEKCFADQLSVINIDRSLYAPALENHHERPFEECVKMMRPVQKYIKRLAESQHEKEAPKYICKLGDNCRDRLEELLKKKPKTNVRKWYNYMWIFLSKLVHQEPGELLAKYRQYNQAAQKHKHREHKEREKERKEGAVKEKEKDKKDHHHHHKKDKPHKDVKEKQRHHHHHGSSVNNHHHQSNSVR